MNVLITKVVIHQMQPYMIFRDLAIIIVAAKLCGIAARKLNIPQVVGEIVAGLIIGPIATSLLGLIKPGLTLISPSDFLSQMAEIGVILLMFSAGLGTDLKELVRTGPVAFAVACCGVFVPLVAGTALYMIFYGFSPLGSPEFYKALFIGVILTATSVSITVKALSELGKLKTTIGTTIVSAAIIDDVIGIIVLTIVVGMGSGKDDVNAAAVILRSLMFFVVSGGLGFFIYKIFKKLDKAYGHTQRIPILGLALCMIMSYSAERFFGVADITGAFIAGVILCNIQDAPYIERKMNINSYMLFGPVFFASIGIKTDISGITGSILIFSICFVIVALLSKIIGCGLAAKLCRYSTSDSAKIGVGMMTRGEVALIVSQKGLSVGLMQPVYFTPVILLIICSSVLTPIVLKLMYSKNTTQGDVLHE